MKIFSIVATILIAAAPSNSQPAAESAVAAQSAEQSRWYVARNVDDLATRSHHRLVILHANGMQRSKEETLANLRSGQPVHSSIDVQDVSVRIAGSTAVPVR